MNFIKSKLPGMLIMEPKIFRDDRGFFYESYHKKKYAEAGIALSFVQDNQSQSVRGVLRGLHMQTKNPQGKLVRANLGEIFDVAVDLRVGSPTYMQWEMVILSSENCRHLYVPPGFAHGFYTLSEVAEVEYKCTEFYDPTSEVSVLWNDPDLGIKWPSNTPILSPKDRAGKRVKELAGVLSSFAELTA